MTDEKKDKKEEPTEQENVENPSDSLTIGGALKSLAGADKFSDVHFVVGKGKEQRVIPAHKVILAAASEFFEAMLYPITFPDEKDRKETKHEDDDIPEIYIPDVRPTAFTLMLQILYSDTTEITADDLEELFDVAQKFQLESVRQVCLNWMEEGVTPDNACILFSNAGAALQPQDKDEKHFALQFIEDNTEPVVATPGWDGLAEEKLIQILQSDDLTIDENDLFQSTLRWALSECRRRGLETTAENRNLCLKNVLKFIRFPTMTVDQIATLVTGSGVLNNQQLLALYTFKGLGDEKGGKKTEFNTTERVGSKDKWSLDGVLKTASVVLSNGNLTARTTGSSYSYVLGSAVFSKGQHAWRVTRDSNNTNWLFLGVSRKLPHNDSSYTQHTVWGFTSGGQSYLAGTSASQTTNFSTGPLEVLLDCNEGILTVANLATSNRFTLAGLPKLSQLVPHFCLQGTQGISVASIPVKDFARGIP